MAFTPPEPDEVPHAITPQGKVPAEPAVTFRGWLADKDGDIYRFFTSPWFDEWLEIKADDLLGKLPGDNVSTVWVKSEARINKCRSEKACRLAEEERTEQPADPTTAFPTAYRPRYPF